MELDNKLAAKFFRDQSKFSVEHSKNLIIKRFKEMNMPDNIINDFVEVINAFQKLLSEDAEEVIQKLEREELSFKDVCKAKLDLSFIMQSKMSIVINDILIKYEEELSNIDRKVIH